MGSLNEYLIVAIMLALASSPIAYASDPSPLQDFCVAVDDYKSAGIYLFYYFYIFLFLLLCILFYSKF